MSSTMHVLFETISNLSVQSLRNAGVEYTDCVEKEKKKKFRLKKIHLLDNLLFRISLCSIKRECYSTNALIFRYRSLSQHPDTLANLTQKKRFPFFAIQRDVFLYTLFSLTLDYEVKCCMLICSLYFNPSLV